MSSLYFQYVNLLLWTISAGIAIAILYGLYEEVNGHPMSVNVARSDSQSTALEAGPLSITPLLHFYQLVADGKNHI
jgi:hypothetical protein